MSTYLINLNGLRPHAAGPRVSQELGVNRKNSQDVAGNSGLLGRSWGLLGRSWAVLGALFRSLGSLLGGLGASWWVLWGLGRLLGRSWVALGSLLEALGSLLGGLRVLLKPLGSLLGGHWRCWWAESAFYEKVLLVGARARF